MSQIPPQAYTRDTLAKAYTWLRSQSESVKDMAQSADMLVSLYLKAQRTGEDSLERPSLQSFKSELKNLAGMMGEFEDHDNVPFRVSSQQILGAKAQAQPPPPQQQQAQTSYTAPPPQPAGSDLKMLLDPRSFAMLQEVRSHLNLSNENEALRLLVSLGFEKVRGLFHK